MKTLFAEIAVFLPVKRTYHYRVPERHLDVAKVGMRVLVSFGSRGATGLILKLVDTVDFDVSKVLDIEDFLDKEAFVGENIVQLASWISSYYKSPLGEVLRAALPAGTTASGSLWLKPGPSKPSGQIKDISLPRLMSLLEEHPEGLPQKEVLKRIKCRRKKLVEYSAKGHIEFFIREEKSRVKNKTEKVFKAKVELDGEQAKALARSKMKSFFFEALSNKNDGMSMSELKKLNKNAASHLREMEKKEWVTSTERLIRKVAFVPTMEGVSTLKTAQVLNSHQEQAFSKMKNALEKEAFSPFLLHGITGSGKTEVYLQIIGEALERGKQALVLVPEISLTPQLAARFRARFGDDVAVLHSGLTKRERFDEWQRLREKKARIALGARSAVFAPVENLGVIVVDEEHDSSFKQEEGVRYHARDIALVRAQKENALCILGSATPSLESYHLSEMGRLEKCTLPERATQGELPEVEIVDLRLDKPDFDTLLTKKLTETISECLTRGEQAILFLNRRGFDTFVVCTDCGHEFRCGACSVSLTVHRQAAALVCHYCGLREAIPHRCPNCNGSSISRRGTGTEKVADGVSRIFPKAKVARLDRDVSNIVGTQNVLEKMATKEIDILIGTQMVTKGHDFPGVTLVGVLLADTGLSLPDFRASEKTFQLLAQVAGRSGRGDKPGKVLIQTYRKEALAIECAKNHDYKTFYEGTIEERKELSYPPFGYLVVWRIDGPHESRVRSQSLKLESIIRRIPEAENLVLLGPCEAPLSRLKGRFRWHLWVKCEDRKKLHQWMTWVSGQLKPDTGIRVSIDVDPVSAL